MDKKSYYARNRDRLLKYSIEYYYKKKKEKIINEKPKEKNKIITVTF